MKFKKELNELFKNNKNKWRSWGEAYVSIGVLFDNFIRELKEESRELYWNKDDEIKPDDIENLINEKAGELENE